MRAGKLSVSNELMAEQWLQTGEVCVCVCVYITQLDPSKHFEVCGSVYLHPAANKCLKVHQKDKAASPEKRDVTSCYQHE